MLPAFFQNRLEPELMRFYLIELQANPAVAVSLVLEMRCQTTSEQVCETHFSLCFFLNSINFSFALTIYKHRDGCPWKKDSKNIELSSEDSKLLNTILILLFSGTITLAQTQTISQTQTQTEPQTQTQTAPQTQTQPEPPPPSTDIFVVDLSLKDGALHVGKPINMTHREGYDNQPSFFSDEEIFYTSIRDDQADIYAFNLRTKRLRQMTKTPESEFSPTLTPDQKFFSVVRVEADKTQRLWKFPIDAGAPTLLLPNVKPVGYHLWAGNDVVLLYILGEPPSLQFAKVDIGKVQRVTDNIGRCLQLIPESNDLSFVQKNQNDEWWIYRMNGRTLEKTEITRALSTEDHDFTWLNDGTILMAQGSQLYRIKPNSGQDWTQVADFADQSIQEITRLAVNPSGTKLAMVALDH